jgi:8-oxo-dGTP pyrophosphatase MutT (NUDIX family)
MAGCHRTEPATHISVLGNSAWDSTLSEEAHAQGLWDQVFSALLVNPRTRTVTLQKKAPGRAGFDRPDYADFTVGGHYEAGEDIPDGVREAPEELGLHNLTYDDFVPLGIRQITVTLSPDRIEREFQHRHLMPYDAPLDSIPLYDAEVSGLDELGLDDAIALAARDRKQADALYLSRYGGSRSVTPCILTDADLIPGYLAIDRLYLRLFITARRYVNGDGEYLFW